MSTRTSESPKGKKMPDSNAIDPSKPLFPIGVVAELLKVHQRTLRIYDEENLLSPNRSAKNRRLYSMEDIERGKFIQYLTRELGINLAGIKIISALLVEANIRPDQQIQHVQAIAQRLGLQDNKK